MSNVQSVEIVDLIAIQQSHANGNTRIARFNVIIGGVLEIRGCTLVMRAGGGLATFSPMFNEPSGLRAGVNIFDYELRRRLTAAAELVYVEVIGARQPASPDEPEQPGRFIASLPARPEGILSARRTVTRNSDSAKSGW